MKVKASLSPLPALAALLTLTACAACLAGKYPITPAELAAALWGRLTGSGGFSERDTVIFFVRLPRVAAAVLIGAGLAAAGAAYQALFNNPLVSPDVLGAQAGAAFGAAAAILSGASYALVSASAFVAGLCAVAAAFCIACRARSNPALTLVLAGIMLASLFSAMTSYIKLIADQDNALPAITYWLMGSLAATRINELRFAALPIAAGLAILMLLSWQLNIISFGEDEARSLGVHPRRVRAAVIAGATLITAAAVSVSGMIGWVGLIVPHFARRIAGCDNRVLLPASMLLGGAFLLTVDIFARTLSTAEIPIGILTAFVGAPFFVFLIAKRESAG